jgi:hypothetical protein
MPQLTLGEQAEGQLEGGHAASVSTSVAASDWKGEACPLVSSMTESGIASVR